MLAVIEIWESEPGKNDGNQRPNVWLVNDDAEAEKKIRDRMTELYDMFTSESDMPDVVDQEYRPNDESSNLLPSLHVHKIIAFPAA